MEDAQKKLILDHLPDLIMYTICNEALLTFMVEHDILSFTDVDTINSIPTETEKASKFYGIIITRKNAYRILLDGLRETDQDEIVQLLSTGILPESMNLQRRTEMLFDRSGEAILFNVSPPDSLFSGRRKELDFLERKITEDADISTKFCVTVISGLGGMGKTQLCRKYIELHKRDFRDTVIWLNAETEMSLSQNFTRLAKEELKISLKNVDGKEMEVEATVNEVYKFLEKKPCLLVFDNVEHSDFLPKFIPLTRTYSDDSIKPTVIMTTRETEWEFDFALVKLSELEEQDAVEMVRKGLKESITPDSEIISLVNRLQRFPLALRQAIAYIRQQRIFSPQYSIPTYLEHFEIAEKEMLSFQNSRVCTQLTTDYSWTTFTTWHMTTQKLSPPTPRFPGCFRKSKEDQLFGHVAMQTLNAIAYIQPDTITLSILKLVAGTNCEQAVFQGALRLLLKYSMITRNGDEDLFSVHRLVQQVTRINLSIKKRDSQVQSKILHNFSANLNEDSADHSLQAWKYCDAKVHANFLDFPEQLVMELTLYQRNTDCCQFAKMALADLMEIDANQSSCFNRRSNGALLAALKLNYRLIGPLRKRERYEEALETCQNVLEKCAALPAMRDNVLIFLVYMESGRCLRALGRLYEAVEHLEKAREGFSRVDHFYLVDADTSLAGIFAGLGNDDAMKRSEELFKNSYKVLLTWKGRERLLTQVANGLGCILMNQKKLSEAQEIFAENLERERQLRGESHAACSASSLYLARILEANGNGEEALRAYKNIHEARKLKYGENEITTLQSKIDVAAAWFKLERYDKALEMFQQVYNSYIDVLGFEESHFSVINCRAWMANTLVQLNEREKARELYETCVSLLRENYGEEFDFTRRLAEKLSNLEISIQTGDYSITAPTSVYRYG